MGIIKGQSDDVYRDSVTAGVPASGANDPAKSEIRALFATVDLTVTGAVAGIVYYATGTARAADTAQPIGKIGKAADETDYYRREGGGWVVDNTVYDGVASVVQPELDAFSEQLDGAIATINAGRRLPILTTPSATYYSVYSTERLIDGVGPLIEMTDGAGGPPNTFGDKQESVTPVSAQIARSGSAAARISRVYDQTGSGRDLIQADTSKQPAAIESITTNGVLAIVVDGKRGGSVTVPIARGLRMTGWNLAARSNTRFMVIEPTVSVAKQLYERWENSNAGASDRNLFTSSSDDPPLSPDVGGNLQYANNPFAIVPSSPFVITITESTTGTDVWFNDVKIANPVIPADGTLTGGYLGYGPDSALQAFNASARYLAYGAVNGALNDSDILAIYGQLASRFNLDPEDAPRIVLIGDSIGEGTQTTYGQNIVYFMRRLLKKRCRIYNLALSGNAMEWAYARRATLEGVLYQGNRRCVAVLQGGINDIQGLGRTGAELYNNTIVPYISYLKGLGYKVVICTLLPETAANVAFAEPQRVAYNNLVRANSGGADMVADLASDPTVGVYPTSANDVTLYADKIHPTARGYAYQAPIYASALNGVL